MYSYYSIYSCSYSFYYYYLNVLYNVSEHVQKRIDMIQSELKVPIFLEKSPNLAKLFFFCMEETNESFVLNVRNFKNT